MDEIPRILVFMSSHRFSAGQQGVLGLAHYARLHGPWIFISEPPHYMGTKNKDMFLKWGHHSKPHAMTLTDTDWIDGLEKLNIPTIIGRSQGTHPPRDATVLTNDQAIGKMAVDYFLGRGFRNFAYCGYKDMPYSQGRGNSIKESLDEKNIKLHYYETKLPKRSTVWGPQQPALINWLNKLPKPIGLVACNDDRGREVIDACRIARINVPEDIAILGIDNEDGICHLCYPSLSSINMNYRKAGYDVAEALATLMAGKTLKSKEILIEPTEVVTRHSTDIMAIEDPHVAAAVNFIRRNRSNPIQVDDVASEVCLSRRALHEKFIRHLDRPIHKEITRVRIEAISQMLLETDLPVSHIAVSLGFDGGSHIARYFSRATGLTPQNYRAKYGFKPGKKT